MQHWKIYRNGTHVFTTYTEQGPAHYIERMARIKGGAYTVEEVKPL